MGDPSEYELLKSSDEQLEPAARHPARRWLAAALLIGATAAAAYIVFVGFQTSAPVTTAPEPVAAAAQQPDQPLGGEAEPVVLPPLDDTDLLVRELVNKITSHPRVAAWLVTDGLIRNFTVAVANVAEGRTPAEHLRVLRPQSAFQVLEQDGDLYVDPLSYQRYDGIATAVASIAPADTARLYATLKPRIEEAHRELGSREPSFDRTLERAIVLLLNTPVVESPVHVRVEPRGIGYGFAAPDVEGLTAAQKQLLRTGPRNIRIIQSSLRQIALALGIPAQRLPAPRS